MFAKSEHNERAVIKHWQLRALLGCAALCVDGDSKVEEYLLIPRVVVVSDSFSSGFLLFNLETPADMGIGVSRRETARGHFHANGNCLRTR